MRVHLDVSGFYDWVPVPEGIEVTPADVRAGLAKEMADGMWRMRVERNRDSTHAMGIPEAAVCDRLAALEANGEDSSRQDVVADLSKHSLKQHLKKRHMRTLTIEDDGPSEAAMALALASRGVTGPAADDALARYMAGKQGDALAAHLRTLLGIEQ